MLKITVLVSLMLIGVIYAAHSSCDSCGSECVRSCGSRRFRACCFNYLRKKRGPEMPDEFWPSTTKGRHHKSKIPILIVEFMPEDVSEIDSSSLKLTEDRYEAED